MKNLVESKINKDITSYKEPIILIKMNIFLK